MTLTSFLSGAPPPKKNPGSAPVTIYKGIRTGFTGRVHGNFSKTFQLESVHVNVVFPYFYIARLTQ